MKIRPRKYYFVGVGGLLAFICVFLLGINNEFNFPFRFFLLGVTIPTLVTSLWWAINGVTRASLSYEHDKFIHTNAWGITTSIAVGQIKSILAKPVERRADSGPVKEPFILVKDETDHEVIAFNAGMIGYTDTEIHNFFEWLRQHLPQNIEIDDSPMLELRREYLKYIEK